MLSYKNLNFQTNSEYNYIEYKLTGSDIINDENFIITLSLISEFLLINNPKYVIIILATTYYCNRNNRWFLKQIIFPQLAHYRINNIIIIAEPIMLQALKKEFERYKFIDLFSTRAHAIKHVKSDFDFHAITY